MRLLLILTILAAGCSTSTQQFCPRTPKSGSEATFVDESYVARFSAAVGRGNFYWVGSYANPWNFPEHILGKVGEGHILAQPPKTEKGYWVAQEIDVWLAEKAKEGYEAATLADGLEWVSRNQQAHRDGPVVFWASVSAGCLVAYLDSFGPWRDLYLGRRNDDWDDDHRFLLRKIPVTMALQVARP